MFSERSAKRAPHMGLVLAYHEPVPIGCVTRCKRTGGRTIWRTAAAARPPKPTSAAFAKRLQPAVGVEHFDAGPGPRVDVIERLMASGLCGVGHGPRHHHAA